MASVPWGSKNATWIMVRGQSDGRPIYCNYFLRDARRWGASWFGTLGRTSRTGNRDTRRSASELRPRACRCTIVYTVRSSVLSNSPHPRIFFRRSDFVSLIERILFGGAFRLPTGEMGAPGRTMGRASPAGSEPSGRGDADRGGLTRRSVAGALTRTLPGLVQARVTQNVTF